MSKLLLFPETIKELLAKRFATRHPEWLAGGGTWPLCLGLGVPGEKDLSQNAVGVRSWVTAWDRWTAGGAVERAQRQFGRLGSHSFPSALVFTDALSVAAAVGQAARWRTASTRYAQMTAEWPNLAEGAFLRGKFTVLADYAVEDFNRLLALLRWLHTNPTSNLYLRQLPVEGLDTKWVEPRRGLVMALMRACRNLKEEGDFYEVCGLRKPAHRFRLRILCPILRAQVGGLCDIEAPASELAGLPVRPHAVVIVENLETGLALPDMPGTVGLMKLGNAVSALHVIPWLQGTRAIYWGDVDTHGFAILHRARKVLPQLESVLMDTATLTTFAGLWGVEPAQCSDQELDLLDAGERQVYEGLRAGTWGVNVRLEQERIPYALATSTLARRLSRRPDDVAPLRSSVPCDIPLLKATSFPTFEAPFGLDTDAVENAPLD